MLIIENFLLALSGIRANKMRALLTMLGIIIGISSVIAIVSIGDSVSAKMEKEMKEMGFANLSVSIYPRNSDDEFGTTYVEPTADDLFTLSKINEFNKEFKGKISAISLENSVGTAKGRYDRNEQDIDINGINEGYATINKIKMKRGRNISPSDIKRSAYVVVIPESLEKKINPSKGEIMGSELKAVFDDKILTFTIIGIYDDSKKSGMMFGGYTENAKVYIPVSTSALEQNTQGYNFFTVMPTYSDKSEELTEEIRTYFDKEFASNKNWMVDIYNAQKDADSTLGMLTKIKLAIAVIAGIALLVGGIGVMNIMLVSVTERTREIGVRKALGAKRAFIKLQFIIESTIICAIGGIIGVILGLSISTTVALVMKTPVVINIPTILISVLFSMSIGVFFGYYPANKAAKLDPIEALRYE